jgi:electron transport complex protein RnfB
MMPLLFTGLIVIMPLCLLAVLFSLRHRRDPVAADASTARDIDRLLPQTQCRKCGYPGCLPYAQAIAAGTAEINRCAPGGSATVRRIAEMLGKEPLPLQQPAADQTSQYARIDETRCIGCVKCIPACPVDAIIGAAKQIHTVIPDWCTGCELCIEPCPVDCIAMIVDEKRRQGADFARARFEARNKRLQQAEPKARLSGPEHNNQAADSNGTDKQSYIKAAVEQSRARRSKIRRYKDNSSASGND